MGKAGKSNAEVVKKREKQLPIKPEGLHAGHWRGPVVDLADFISRVSTARADDHIIAGVAAEEPPEIGGLLVPDGISATLIACRSQDLPAPPLCSRGVVRVLKVVMLQWEIRLSLWHGSRPLFRFM